MMGRLILDSARAKHPNTNLNSEFIQESTKSIFTALFAVTVSTYLFQSAPKVTFAGSLSTTSNRLFMVNTIAYILIAALSVLIILLILMQLDVHANPSVLFEEPAGLVGQAGVLFNSIVSELAKDARNVAGFDGKTTKIVKDRLNLESKNEIRFQMVNKRDPINAHIEMIGGLDRINDANLQKKHLARSWRRAKRLFKSKPATEKGIRPSLQGLPTVAAQRMNGAGTATALSEITDS